MKKIMVSILVCLLFIAAPATTLAAAEPVDILRVNVSGQMMPNWVHQQYCRHEQPYGMNETVPNSFYMVLAIGRDSADGSVVLARGDLLLTGTAHGFPTAQQKTGIFEGTLLAYLNGNLLPL